jgi:omega-amidase
MHAHLIQLNISWENPSANFAGVEALLADAPINPGDLILLPELFDTGFSLNTAVTNDADGHTEAFLTNLAKRLSVTVQGGRTVLPAGKTHALNIMSVIDPAGLTVCTYAKIHPFSFGREPEAFAGGDEIVTYSWNEKTPIRCAPAICYDLRFPELFRFAVKQGAELIALGANWPSARQHHWRTMLIARAIENQAFVLGVNRTGSDPHLHYAGGSIIISPKGDILAEADNQECVLTGPIDPALVHAWRKEFPALQDARLLGKIGHQA